MKIAQGGDVKAIAEELDAQIEEILNELIARSGARVPRRLATPVPGPIPRSGSGCDGSPPART